MQYRVAYGNGQVSNTMTLAEARRHLADCRREPQGGWAYIQFRDQDTGEWFRSRQPEERSR